MARDRKLRKICEEQFKRLNEPIPPEKQNHTLLDRIPQKFTEAQQRLIEEANRGGTDIRTL